MDVSPLLALLLIALLSLLFFLLSSGSKRKATPAPDDSSDGRHRRLPLPLPPSPRGGLPILGHLPLLGPLPHRTLRAMAQAHGPVMLLRLGRVPTVVASSAAAAREVLRTRDLAFPSRPTPMPRMADRLLYGGRDMGFAPYGEHWRQARRVCVLHLLSHRRVASFRHSRELDVAAMLARVRREGAGNNGGAAVNLTAHIISYTNGVFTRAAFGDRGGSYYGGDGPDGGEKLADLFADFEGLLGTVTMGDFVPWLAWVDAVTGLDARAARTAAEVDAVLERVITDHRQRRRHGGGSHRDGDGHRDFVDVLLDVNEDEAADAAAGGEAMFNDVAIKAIILDMFAAATDTTYTTLVWAIAELVNHPHEMRRVQEEVRAAVAVAGGGGDRGVTEDHLGELRHLRCVIKETLRLRTPLPLLLPHETTAVTELLGYRVPARTRVIVNAWAIARDPATWERADEFMPERFAGDDDLTVADYMQHGQDDFRFVPFGGWRRGCPGVGFSGPTMELALASLLYHFDWELPAGGPSKIDMDEVNGLSVRLKANLCLVAKPWCPQ